MTDLAEWLTERKIDEVECLVPDINGIARGKILPATKFIKSARDESLRLPESIFIQTVTGEYSENEDYEDIASDQDPDIYLKPDAGTIRVVPWYQEPTAQVICDAYNADGTPVEMSARQVLRRVLSLYEERGWMPIVAPELEFFLVQVNTDPDLPLLPPVALAASMWRPARVAVGLPPTARPGSASLSGTPAPAMGQSTHRP